MSHSTEECIMEKLKDHFYMGSLNFSIQPEEVEAFIWDEQQKFLNATVYHPIVEKYPVSAEFCRLFFKKVIDSLEPTQEVHDGFYTYLCLVIQNNTQQDFCYKHYVVDNDLEKIITIKETKNMVVNGTTGMRTWQAALMLADYMICNKDLLREKNILELGSGVGFTGIAISKYCDINSITLTDCHNDVLKTIYENIQINFPFHEPKEYGTCTVFSGNINNIHLMMLDWNDINDFFYDIVPDVIIGADIIYDPILLKPLCKVMKHFFDKNKSLEVYIANVIRNEDTYKAFLELLDRENMTCENMPQIKCVHIKWDFSIEKCLLKIRLK
ncbi:lysine methyltransferase domain-containing protein [Phthorimaea operculella]|nr:lysine methyltransferase domain-containing protein [Phthorimaea operculella]